jgi:predicted nucleotidyltransferase
MTWLKTTATVRDIADVVAQIVQHFHLPQVILFGSYASGTPTPDSDVHLLVVMETRLRSVEQAVAIRKAVDFPFPVDVLVRTPQYIAEHVALEDAFLREALAKGVGLYVANDTGRGEQS